MPGRPSSSPSLRRRALVLAAGAVPLQLLAQPAGGIARDTLVKAAFLHKFASFVEWPEGTFARPDVPLRIGILGDELIWRDLSELARDRDRDGRPVAVVRLHADDALAGFHILYLKAPSAARLADLLASVPPGVLTISDSNGAHPRGSVLSFAMEEGRIRFGVSLEAATRQRLRLHPRLVAAARLVGPGPAPGATP
jgi:hypothetical protein